MRIDLAQVAAEIAARTFDASAYRVETGISFQRVWHQDGQWWATARFARTERGWALKQEAEAQGHVQEGMIEYLGIQFKRQGKRGRKFLDPKIKAARKRAYLSRYYQEHRAEIASQRKDQRVARKQGQVVPPRRPGRKYVVTRVEIAGRLEPCYSVGYLAQVVGIPADRMRRWHQDGVLPVSPYQTGRGEFYTAAMIAAAAAVLQARMPFRGGDQRAAVAAEIAGAWQRIGVDL